MLGFLALPSAGIAQYFEYNPNGDLLAGFRKTGQFQGNYELVVNIGNITNFLAYSAGTTVAISNVSPARLTDSFPDGYGNLQWSVFAAFPASSPWVTSFGAFPKTTLWYTFPSATAASQTVPPQRVFTSAQATVRQRIESVGPGAYAIGAGDLIATNADNNAFLVREPVTYSDNILTAFMGDPSDPSLGDFGGQAFTYSVENTTPGTFASAARSDFYQSCPASYGTGIYVDPITDLTNGPAYFVGYFLLNPNGTMTFTRASTNSVVSTPPPPVRLSIARSGNASMISFLSSNSVTYTLYFTNAAGLGAPVANWPLLSGAITGDGTTKSFQDATTDPARFYRVQEK